ncbi:poly-beta-1,6-N-acetyl-D-glucosamine N-deacetylase [Clostridiales bacterium]|nr:poly-beta-1,6-N-acetyl-D-glucosamine N-deacetylase [Clostridiales bacterium]
MKRNMKITAFLMTVLVLSCMTAGCAQPLLRSANTETAQQTTYADAMDSSPVQTDTPVTTDLPETTVPETLPPETTAPAPLQTMEVTGGGNIDLSPKGDNHDGSTGTYAPSALMYHLILEQPYTELTNLFVRPTEFEDHLQKLCAADCIFLFADEYALTEKKSIILTFDDGYEDNYTQMFPILKKYGAKATVFMITSKINMPGYLTEDMIREMAASGLVRFESHTHTHPSLTSLSAEDLAWQFAQSGEILYNLTGRYPQAICYPGGTVNDFVIGEAAKCYRFGYTTHNSADTSGCDPLALSRVRVSRGMSGNAVLSRLGWG